MTKHVPLLIGAILLGAAGAVSAQTTAPSSTPSAGSSTVAPEASQPSGSSSTQQFAKLDKDQDGMISKKEASKDTKLSKGFSTADESKDGKLDPAEFAQFEAGGSEGSLPMTP